MAYQYEYASVSDGEEITELLENVEFKGEISVAYCRRPNAVLSLAKDGEKSTFIIARDNDGKIFGAGGCVIKDGIAYLTGLRATRLADIPNSYKLLREFCIKNGARLTYTTILEGNTAVQKMLEKKRPNMPAYIRHSQCVVNIIRKNLSVKDRNNLVKKNDFYVLENPEGVELARGKVTEQGHKQYIIKRYGWKLRLAKIFFKWMPDENEILKYFTLREVSSNDNGSLESFLRHISRLPLQVSFFLYGGTVCPVKSLKYRSIAYIVDWDKTITDASKINLEIEIADL
jgi:hypothetical protein